MEGNYEVVLGGPHPKVTVDGQELPVAALYVEQKPGEFPRVYATLDASRVDITGSGTVQVDQGARDISTWLASVDPRKLEAEVFAQPSMSENPIDKAIEILKAWAQNA